MKNIIIIPILLLFLGFFLFQSDKTERIEKADEICLAQFPITFSYQNMIDDEKTIKDIFLDYEAGIDLSNLYFTELPDDIFKNTPCIKKCNFASNSLLNIPTAIQYLPQLIHLDLNFNTIKHISRHSFVKNKALQYLNLDNNKIRDISFSTFEQNKELQYINLNNNQLQTLDLNTFKTINRVNLTSNSIDTILPIIDQDAYQINHLNLNRNKLTSIDLNALKSIKSLKLGRNNIKKIQPIRQDNHPINTTSLDLAYNKLSRFPVEIFLLDKLESLDLEYNNIGSDTNFIKIPFEKLQMVNFLNLSKNGFLRFPEELGKMPNLEWLFLDKNQITGSIIFKDFDQLSRLKIRNQSVKSFIMEKSQVNHIDLSGNQIHTFKVTEKNTTLNELTLRDNQLSKLSPSINQLVGLNRLDLSHNNLKNLPDLSDLTNLKELELTGNDLTEIPNKDQLYPKYNNNPFTLYLSFNSIKTLDFERVNKNITELVLSNNNISSIENLTELPNLKKLYLNGNSNLKEFSTDVLYYLTNLEELNLENTSLDPITVYLITQIAKKENIQLTIDEGKLEMNY